MVAALTTVTTAPRIECSEIVMRRVLAFLFSVVLLIVVAMFSVNLVAVPSAAAAAAAENFSIVVFPDTQYSADSFPQAFEAQGRWVRDNRDARNIRYAVHVGDVVDESNQNRQWRNATSSMGLLEGRVPYIIGVGNHDMDAMPRGQNPAVVRDAEAFNSNFPRSKFSNLPSFGGSLPASRNDNSYHKFTAGGTDWMVLALKYVPTDAEIAWANQIIAANPRHQVMIVTHAYQRGTQRDATGNKLWAQLVSRHANVSFVFSGHYVNQGLITERGQRGNTVYQVQADYQNANVLDPNSYLRIMEFNPTAKTVDVKTYSPYLNRNLTDARNQFVIRNVEFMPGAGQNDFSLGLFPAAGSTQRGGSTTTTVSTTVTSGSAQAVNLSSSGAPPGTTVSFSPASVTAGGSSTIRVTATSAAATGSFPITVTGTAPSGSRSATYALTVGSPPQPGALTNAGFEADALSPWTAQPGGAVVGSPAHSGSRALLIAATSAQTGEASQAITLAPNTSYTLRAWVQGNSAFIGVAGGASANAWTSASGWTQLSVPFTTGSSGEVTVFAHGWYGQGNVFADDFTIS